jgi:predicted GNAT family N-acyltransferase
MTFTISLGSWSRQKASARLVREVVFLAEQKIPEELEWDEWDELSIHAVAADANGVALGTGRLLPDGHIGRMAVLANVRGQGVGRLILQSLMQAAQQRGDKRVVLSAQSHAQDFYRRYGFKSVGEEYKEAEILHIEMACYF